MDTLCGHILWTLFVDIFVDIFVDTLVWYFLRTIFVDISCGHLLWTLFVDTFCGNFWWTVFVSTFFVDTFSWHFFLETYCGRFLWTLVFNTYLSFWLMPQARLIWSAPYRCGALLSRPTTVWNLIPTVWHWWLPTETTWTQPLPRSFYQVSAGQKLSTDCWWWYIILRLSRLNGLRWVLAIWTSSSVLKGCPTSHWVFIKSANWADSI